MELYAKIAVTLPDKDEIIRAGPTAELVYYRAILRCKANLTDGRISDERIPRWFAGIDRPRRALDKLASLGLIDRVEGAYQFPQDVWFEWNTSKADVEQRRAEETARKAAWRERKRRSDDTEPEPPDKPRRNRDATATTGHTRPRRDRDAHATRISETETETETETEKTSGRVGRKTKGDRATSTTDERLGPVLELIVDDLAERFPTRANRERHRTTIRTDVLERHGATITARLAQLPNSQPDVIVDSLRQEIS